MSFRTHPQITSRPVSGPRLRTSLRAGLATVLALVGLAASLAVGPAPSGAAVSDDNGLATSPRDLDYGGGYRPFSGDFDGDGNTDIFWYGPGAVTDRIEFSGPSRAFVTIPVTGNYLPFVGDFDGDRRDDVFWYMPGPTPDFVWYSSGRSGFRSLRKDVGGTFQPVVGRFTFDATDDIIWYAPGAAPDFFWDFEADRTAVSKLMPINGSYRPLVANLSDHVQGQSHPGIDDVLWVSTDPRGGSAQWLMRSDGSFSSTTINGIGGRQASFVPMATNVIKKCRPGTGTGAPYGPAVDCYPNYYADPTRPARPTVILTATGATPMVLAASGEALRPIDIGQGRYGRSGAVAIPVMEPTGKVTRSLVFFSASEKTSSWDCDAVDSCNGNNWFDGAPEAAGTLPLRYGRGGAEVVLYRPSGMDSTHRTQQF